MNNIDTILTEMGWQDGFRIPVANEENKQLEIEIERKMKLKTSLNEKLESTEERIEMIKKHTSNLTVEQNMNQKLLTDHSAQIQTEDHHYRLSCNTESSLRHEARNFQKEWREVNEIVSNIEKDLVKMTKKIEISKKTIKFDELSLQKWEETLNQNEENNQLIEKYMKEDAKVYKEWELKRQKLSMELKSYQKAIIRSADEAREMEIVLDRTAKLYNQALKEYRQMFNQWRESVIMLQQRNDDIEKILREIETLHEILRDKKNVLQESDKFLSEQVENNRKLEESIKVLEKKLFTMKEEHHKIKDMTNTYETELRVQKNAVKELSQRAQQVRANIKRKELQIEVKYAKVEELKKHINNLNAKLGDIDSQKLNVEEKTKELEIMIEEQEKRKAVMTKEVNRLQAANLRTTNQIKEIESKSKVLKMQYQNECKKAEYLDSLFSKDETSLEEKKEVLYQVEFELQKSEMKLERLRGHERDKSEAERKQKKIEELQTSLNEKTEISKLLQKQISNLEHEMKKIANSLTSDNNELERLRNKKQDLVLLMDGGEKRVKAAQTLNEEKQVEESMLRFKVSQMEKIVSNLDNNVYDLEKYRVELEAAIRERKAEIAIRNESLIVQKRIAASECSEVRSAIAERRGRIRQLQARYESGLALFGSNPDGTPMNTAYLKIQSAQERYFLQEQGDKLDETIRKTEQEIQSMENTLRVINACNDKYKTNLIPEKRNELEEEERKKLNEDLCNAEEKMRCKEQELQRLTENLKKMEGKYARLVDDIEKAKQHKEEKERYLADLRRQIKEQKEKMLRADKNLRAAKKDIQNVYASTGDRAVLVQEKEVELREIQEQNAVVLQDIAEFTIRHVEAEAYVKKLLAVKNIQLPSVSLFDQSPLPSATSSAECPPKSTSRTSAFASSRESIGSIINIEPQFDSTSINNASERESSTRSSPVKYTPVARSKQQSRKKCS